MKRFVVLLLFVASGAHAGLPTRSDCARMLGVDPATGRINKDLIPREPEPERSARENFKRWLYPAPKQKPVKQPFHYFMWHPFAKTRDAKRLAVTADELLTKPDKVPTSSFKWYWDTETAELSKHQMNKYALMPRSESNTIMPRSEVSTAESHAGQKMFLGKIEESALNTNPFAAKLRAEVKAGKVNLKVPVEGQQRSLEEITAWTEYLKTSMNKPDFTVDEFFAILDVGFSNKDFQISKMLNVAHVDSIEFVREGTKFQRTFKKADGYAKSGANLDVKNLTKIMSTQLKFNGEIPSDPQGMALWLQDVTRVLHSGAKQALGQSVDTAFDFKGRKAAETVRDRLDLKVASMDEGAYKIMRELDQFIVDSYARETNDPSEPLSPLRLGFLPNDSKVAEAYDYMKDLTPHLYYRLKVYIKAGIAGRVFGPFMGYVGLAGDWMKPQNPIGRSPFPLDGKRKYTKAELGLIRSRARSNMVHYLNGRIVEKWALRGYMAYGLVKVGMLGFTLYESDEDYEEAHDKSLQTTDKKDETNTNIKEGPGVQYATKDQELEAVNRHYEALLEEHQLDKQKKSQQYKTRERKIAELYKQVQTLSGELDGALQD